MVYRFANRRGRVACWAVTAGLVGCVTTTSKSVPMTPSDPPPRATTPADARATEAAVDTGPVLTPDQAVSTDASAARLHDISGAMLVYVALHRRLPPSLDALRPLADPGTDLPVVAPSGQPYLYTPVGLTAMGATKRIIVADPTPSPTGTRACILVPPPGAAGAALSMEVVTIPEATFRAYSPSG